jgi:hypothetical protein
MEGWAVRKEVTKLSKTIKISVFAKIEQRKIII